MDTIIRKQVDTEYSVEKDPVITVQELSSNELEILFRPLIFMGMDKAFPVKKTRPKAPKISSIAKNGLSVENIRKAGHGLWVHHYRAYYSSEVKQTIFLPSGTRHLKDPTLKLLPNKGYTRVTLIPNVTHDSPKLDGIIQGYDDKGDPARSYYGTPLYYTSYCYHGGEVVTTHGGDYTITKPDLFCYKLGATQALDRIPKHIAEALLDGPLTNY